MTDTYSQLVENENIPSPPAVALRLIELAGDMNSSVQEILAVISADPKLAARIIDYSNSPLNGFGKEVSSLQQAVVLLGLRTLRLLSLSFSLVETKKEGTIDFGEFWRASMVTAIAAKTLKLEGTDPPDESFLLGLVFNIGAIAIGTHSPEMLKKFDSESCPAKRAEMELDELGMTRFEVGAQLLKKWHFPKHMVKRLEDYAESKNNKSTKYYLAMLVAKLVVAKEVAPGDLEFARDECLELADMASPNFTKWFNEICREFQVHEKLFNTSGFSYQSIDDLEQRAKDSIFRISMGLETELKRVAEQNEILATCALTDPLTGLKNRAAYEKEIDAALDYHQRRRRPFAILVIDIDRFKSINDTFGHAVGDQVLVTVAERLLASCRKYDAIYRFGGEEFLAILADCDLEASTRVAERFRSTISNCDVRETLGNDRKITVSVGVCWIADGSCEIEEAFEMADSAMYAAKKNGRNRVELRRFDEKAPSPSVQIEGLPASPTSASPS